MVGTAVPKVYREGAVRKSNYVTIPRKQTKSAAASRPKHTRQVSEVGDQGNNPKQVKFTGGEEQPKKVQEEDQTSET